MISTTGSDPQSGVISRPPRLGVALIAVAWVFPFVQYRHRPPIPSFLSEWVAVVAGLALCAYAFWHSRGKRLVVPFAIVLPLGMAVLFAAHAFVGASGYRHTAGMASLYMLWAALLVMAGGWLSKFDKVEVAAQLCWCLVVGAVIAALAGLLQMFEVREFLGGAIVRFNGRVTGNIGSPNHLALYLAIGSASLVCLFAQKRLSAFSAPLVGVVLMFVLAASGSRTGWIYLGVMMVASLLWSRERSAAEAYRALALCLALSVAYLLANLLLQTGLLGPVGEKNAVDRLRESSSLIGLRSGLWEYSVRMFLEHPIFGVGWGNFAWELFLRNDGTFWVGWDFDSNAHNLLFHLLAEGGLLGLAVLTIPLASWGLRTFHVARGAADYWAFSVLGLVAVHAMLEYTLWYAYFLGIAAVLIGWLDPGRRETRAEVSPRVPVLLLLTVAWLAGQTLKDNYVLEEALDPKALEAPGVIPKLITDMVAMQRSSLLMPDLERILAMGLLADTRGLAESLEISDRVVRRAPTPHHVFRHAVLLMLSDQGEAAERLIRHGISLFGHLDGAYRVAADMIAAGERLRPGGMGQLGSILAAAQAAPPGR